MAITREQVQYTAELARLDLTEDELGRFARDLDRILEYVDQLKEVDAGDPAASPSTSPGATPLRADEPRASFTQRQALAGAPDCTDGLFRVPKVIG